MSRCGFRAALAALVVLAAAGAAAASDWPRFRGPDNNGISPEKGINKAWAKRPPRLLWKVDLHDDGYAGPSVANGLVTIVDHEGTQDVVRALRLADGSEAWRYAYEETNRTVYGHCRTTPTVDGGRVYVLSRLGRLVCLEARTGKEVWSRDIVADFKGRGPMWDIAACPFVDGKVVIVFPGGPGAAVAALDKATGKTVWQGGGGEQPAYTTPTIATIGGVRQYVTMDAKGAVGYAAADGTRLWHYPWETRDGTNIAVPIVLGDAVFITSSYGMGCALLDVRGGEAAPRYRSREMCAHFNTPVLVDGLLYGTGDPGHLMCLDPLTGKVRWRQPGFEKGGVVAVDGTLIAMNGSNGDVVQVKLTPNGYQELGRITPLGGQSWSPPVVAQGRLFVRNHKALACLDLR